MFELKPEMIQSYILSRVTEKDSCNPLRWNRLNGERFFYEFTITFNPQYWRLGNAMASVGQAIADVCKPIIRDDHKFQLDYSIEYHENGMPHIHGQVITEWDIHPEIQRNIHQRLCRRYGRSQWFQTGLEDMFHTTSGMKWSEYIRKDVLKNQVNGMKHFYSYQFRLDF